MDDAARLLWPGAAVAAAYAVVLGYRLDAAGHLCGGYGLVLLLAAAWPGGRRPWAPLVLVAAALVIGLLVERTLFGRPLFDWFDVANQSVGIGLAGCALVGWQPTSPHPRRVLAGAGAGAILLGASLSFGPGAVLGVVR